MFSLRSVFSWSEHFDLSDVCVSTTLLVLKDYNLDVHGLSGGSVFIVQWEYIPADWVFKLDLLDLLQFVETVSDAD